MGTDLLMRKSTTRNGHQLDPVKRLISRFGLPCGQPIQKVAAGGFVL